MMHEGEKKILWSNNSGNFSPKKIAAFFSARLLRAFNMQMHTVDIYEGDVVVQFLKLI